MIDKPNWKDLTIKFAKAYHADLPNFLALGSELDRWETFWKNEYLTRKSIQDNIVDVLKDITSKKHWFPNIYAILCLVAVIPASSNSCERSISKLRLIKTYLRSTMGQDRLSGLALLNAHREVDINYEDLLDIFGREYRHHLKMVDILNN